MNHLEMAIDSVDACVFSGDSIENESNRELLKEYCERWLRAIDEHEKNIGVDDGMPDQEFFDMCDREGEGL